MVYCAVQWCNNEQGKSQSKLEGRNFLRFFNFPKDPKLAKSWKLRIGRRLQDITNNMRVCSDHFADTDFINHVKINTFYYEGMHIKLKPMAVPNTDSETHALIKTSSSTPESVSADSPASSGRSRKRIRRDAQSIWLNGTRTQHNEKLLNGVQRLANVLITGAMPSTPGVALDVITGNIPITLWLEEESAKGALRLKNLNHWQHPPSGKLNMRLTSHITTNEKLLKSISEVRVPHDQKTPSLSIDQGFAVDIPNRDVFSEPIESEYDVNCYTDGSKMNEHVGAGIVVKSSPSKGCLNHNEAFHLDKHNTVLQAEVFAVGKTATFLLDNKIEGSKIMINCDSQAAIRAIDSTVIKNSTTLEATMALNTLGESNEITLRWIPAHCGYEGNGTGRSTCKERLLQ